MMLSAKKPLRSRDLARIHILKAQLKLDDAAYRNVLWVHGRVESSADLDSHGRAAVIKHMESHLPTASVSRQNTPHNLSARDRGELQKIEALLTDADKPWAYAEAILRTQTRGQKTRMAFASSRERVGVVAALHRQAIKRLSAELLLALGEDWARIGAGIAEREFGLGDQRNFTAYPQMMSQVLRWHREMQSQSRD